MKNFTSIFYSLALAVFVSPAFAQVSIPAGYVSLYTVASETERAGSIIAGGTNSQLLGPGAGWGEDVSVDLSNYEKLVIGFTYNSADAGHQGAMRFACNGSAKDPVIITYPATGTTGSVELNLSTYANTEGKVRFGGIMFYNGATHWSFSYSGTAATQPITIDYVAIKQKAGSSVQLTEQANDPVVDVKYYNLQGKEIPQALEKGVYIVKKIYASHKTSVTKVLK